MFLRVFVKQDTRDGRGTGKLHGRQVFVCKTNFALFVPIEAVIPEEDFDENPVKLLAKSLSYSASSSGKLPFKIHL